MEAVDGPALHAETLALARGANYAAVTTLLPDGHPQTQITWVDADDEHLLINTPSQTQKARNARRDPPVTVTIWNATNPFQYVEVRGTVTEIRGPEDATPHIHQVARKYFGGDSVPGGPGSARRHGPAPAARSATPMTGPVLVVGGTGMLGRHVVGALQSRGRPVRAVVRLGSDATALESSGVHVIRGDMLEPTSLRPAFDGVDAVITSAAGYTRRRKTDTADTDTIGNRNLADAALQAQVRRFVLTGILKSDQTPEVPHFWNKTLAEHYLAELGVPYVSLRPAAFFDQIMDLQPGGGLRAGRLISPGAPQARQSFVLSTDVAEALASLVDAPVREGEHVDLGWQRPLSQREIAVIAAAVLGRRVRPHPAGTGPPRTAPCRGQAQRPDRRSAGDDRVLRDRAARRRHRSRERTARRCPPLRSTPSAAGSARHP